MENTKYYITQEQLDSLEHNKDMFALNADRISDLCNEKLVKNIVKIPQII